MAVSCLRKDCENNDGIYCRGAAWGLEIDAQGQCITYKRESDTDEPGGSSKLSAPTTAYTRPSASKR